MGPLVISLVVVSKGAEKKFVDIGVRDSKLLSRKKRESLYDMITDISQQVLIDKIMPVDINSAMFNNISINELEAARFARLFDKIEGQVDKLYLDSPDVIPERFGTRVKIISARPSKVRGVPSGKVAGAVTTIIAEHKADSRYSVVSAASIMAKVVRDREVKKMERTLKLKLHSGYPSDKHTIEAITKNLSNPILKPYMRLKWKTLARIRQTKLYNYNI